MWRRKSELETNYETYTTLVDLARNGTLEELDITGNSMGDHAFSDLCRSLRSNDGLKSLKCDRFVHNKEERVFILFLEMEFPILGTVRLCTC